jgi:methanogenic corrinoid protein MtbC1
VQPVRTPKGGRLYSEYDVRKLAAIRDLVRLGHAVSTIAGMPLKTLRTRLAEAAGDFPAASDTGHEQMRAQFLASLEQDDWWSLEQMLNQWAIALPPRELVLHVLAPVIEEVGARWFKRQLSIGQEHLATALIRTLLGNLLRQQIPHVGAPMAVAATTSGERHELGLLMASLLVALQGWRVHYLGPDIPMAEVVRAVEDTGAATVLLSLVSDTAEHVAQLASLRASLPERVEVWAGGRVAVTCAAQVPGIRAMTLEDVDARFAVE